MSEIKDLIDFTYKYPDEEAANAFYIQKRWGKRFYCPHCGADKANIKTIKKKTEEHFYCSKCRNHSASEQALSLLRAGYHYKNGYSPNIVCHKTKTS